jgi:hypothetical protein
MTPASHGNWYPAVSGDPVGVGIPQENPAMHCGTHETKKNFSNVPLKKLSQTPSEGRKMSGNTLL